MKTSAKGVAFIAQHEGFIGRPYKDVVGVWTIGFGHTGPDVFKLGVLSIKTGLELLRKDLGRYEAPVNAMIEAGARFTQWQFDALVSLVYNCGPGCVAPRSTIRGLAVMRRNSDIPNAMRRWNKGMINGRLTVIRGLDQRRKEEAAIFMHGSVPARVQKDPLASLTPAERRWCREYDRLKARGLNPARRRELRAVMLAQRKAIWRLSQSQARGGDGHGWDYRARRTRYHSLLARTQ